MTTSNLKIAVLAGGLSHEREISLQSGLQVAEALGSAGYTVSVCDIDTSLVPKLRELETNLAFSMLHGSLGEDGAIQTLCEALGLAYVGSTAGAAHLAFDKFAAKSIAQAQGLITPPAFIITTDTIKLLGAAHLLTPMVESLGFPLVVKPNRGGSSLGLSVVQQADELTSALVHAFAYDSAVLLEKFIVGTEVALTVIDAVPGWGSLPAVEIKTGQQGYDYTARYTVGESQFVIPAGVGPDVLSALTEAAESIHQALGLRDYSRADFIVDPQGQHWFLEVNVSPGMTINSLLPQAVHATGRTLTDFCSALVEHAYQRTNGARFT